MKDIDTITITIEGKFTDGSEMRTIKVFVGQELAFLDDAAQSLVDYFRHAVNEEILGDAHNGHQTNHC